MHIPVFYIKNKEVAKSVSITSENSTYVILIGDDNTMTATQKKRLVQRSKLVDDLVFLVKPEYNGYNMAEFTVVLEYLSPVSHTYRTEFLTKSDDDYNGYLKYMLPVDTCLTAEAGNVELLLTFLLADLDENGKDIQRSRKITGTSVNIVPISAWSDIIPDCALSALDQRIIKIDSQIKALNETSAVISDSKADNITYDKDTNAIQLMSGDKLIGDKVVIGGSGATVGGDGVPVVDLNKIRADSLSAVKLKIKNYQDRLKV